MRILKEIFSIKDLRRKILFVFFMLFIYKVGTYIVVPGIDASLLEALNEQTGMLGFANMLSGGSLSRFSIFAVGIMPYITASIIIQLLQMDIVPRLAQWNKEGEKGKKKTKRLTRIVTVFLALGQSFGFAYSFNSMYPGLVMNPSTKTYIFISLILTLGTIILMVLGELIEKKGIGQGISLIISSGIIMGIPNAVYLYYLSDIETATNLFIAIVKTILLVLLLCALIVGVIYIHRGERRIPIQYSNQNMGNYRSSLPIKVNSAGVMPVIFAVSIVMFPMTIAQFMKDNQIVQNIASFFDYTNVTGMIIFVITIILFTYFYAFLQMSPDKVADNLKKSGGFIPGIRPGKPTEEYISNVLSRITFIGAIFLSILSVIPMIISKITTLPPQIQIGGMSLIIMVSVTLDLGSRINSYLIDRKYDDFLS